MQKITVRTLLRALAMSPAIALGWGWGRGRAKAAPAASADPLTVDNGGVTVKGQLNADQLNAGKVTVPGVQIAGVGGRNHFLDTEKTDALGVGLRVGSAWNVNGIYSEKGPVVVGSEKEIIWLVGGVGVGRNNWQAPTGIPEGTVKADVFIGKGAVPVGAILMWSGALNNIPAGWVLCDGRTVGAVKTPDLRGRFVVGYDQTNSDYNGIGKTGGEAKHTLTIAEMPAHSHTGNTGINSNDKAGGWGGGGTMGLANTGGQQGTRNQHTHPIPSDGGGQPHENRPPYYVLAYIMYTG
jgi:microcystin-dependent protein